MPWPKDHKRNTRARIVEAAAAEFRQHGIAQVGVAEVMRRAGLTHGGFYAHFDSRDDLVIEAFTHAMDRSTERWRKLVEQTPREKRFATIVNSYLTSLHRDDPGRGCAIPTLGAEIARESARTRRVFAGRLDQMIDILADQVPNLPRKAARKRAAAAMATMIGTLVMARVAGSGDFSDEILGAGREALLGRTRSPKPRKSASGRATASMRH